MIGAAGAVAAGAALTPVVFAANESGGETGGNSGDNDASAAGSGASGTAPEKFPATRTHAATGTAPATTAFAASYVGVRWSGAPDGAGIRFTGGDASAAWHPLGGGCARGGGGGAGPGGGRDPP